MIQENNIRCTGCGACACICPSKSIVMEQSYDGFLYPHINLATCVKCQKCNDVCPIDNHDTYPRSQNVYAFKNEDNIRELSTSGGFFSLISNYFYENSGVVYGAVFDNSFAVYHIRSTSWDDGYLMRGSKYVQSDLKKTFQKVLVDLQSNRLVLFSGTPCQISGLNNFLKLKQISVEKLFTCDFICHGVPSPLIWKRYLEFLENKYRDNIQSVYFRNKREQGWHKPCLEIIMNAHKQILPEAKEPFYQLFYSNCILRTSCHSCEYTNLTRVSDVTMGDCWGIENVYPEFDDNRGISMVMLNSEKMCKLYEVLSGKGKYIKIKIENLNQPHLYRPATMSRRRKKFWKDFYSKSFRYILDVYGYYSPYMKVVKKIKKMILKVIKL